MARSAWPEVAMHDVERALAAVTPRVATVGLLRFGEVIERYDRHFGRPLSRADRRFVCNVFRLVLAQECRA